ncbi:hypothetical protein E3P99_03008 [Wallemia hederae]|uniref:CMP/dCMP-type deaminase domain-containing protein n=1 Tax=Wallemia hederae TaxID=1540922 RepID=A0A4T0FJY7_9BASI|nr:hypothetical protein E3P99_03008 [Wallemia hederae]
MTLEKQTEFISAALQEAYKCTPAKANAIDKLQDDAILPHTDLYTTLEPCTTRTSGLHPCTATIITNNIKRVFIGASEPPDYVVCQGVDQLRNAGVDVIFIDSTLYTQSTGRILGDDCLAAARRGQ